MKRKLFAGLILATTLQLACASTPVRLPALSKDERSIITALLRLEARHPENPSRAILILDSTDPWVPGPATVPTDLPAYASQIVDDIVQDNRLVASIAGVNSEPIQLNGVALPPNARLYSRQLFDQERDSPERFRAMVRRLGGFEPLVFSVSRPAVDGDNGAVLLHVLSTWSGCGGVDLFEARRSAAGWRISSRGALVVW